ncbi:O-methyltransferase [Corynebacterium caspium]|uniref:O-methyltransferase n=1 Tax=Corynebacterium caspium TaxID=234828 RepID=UPI0006846A59|nr:methyltransferase [Corynebacterium caspium]
MNSHPTGLGAPDAAPAYSQALAEAREYATEFGLVTPDEATGSLLASLAATAQPAGVTGAIVVSPAACVVGLYLLRGVGEKQTITCIDPEAEHIRRAQKAFRAAGQSSAKARTLTARPLEVLSRMAPEAYQLVYADISPMDIKAMIETALPLLCPGGSLVLGDALLDATITDKTRTDRYTVAAREAFQFANALDPSAYVVTHLPLGAGLTLITRR